MRRAFTVALIGLAFSVCAFAAAESESKAAESKDQNQIAVTWWGCMSVEVNIGDVNIVFDPDRKSVV